jgi:hypothetical protein
MPQPSARPGRDSVLTPELEAAIASRVAEILAAWPPLTEQQMDDVAALMNGRG